MNTYVKEYTSFMTDIRHKSLNTVESYKRDVTQYISYLDGTGVTDISSTTKTTVLSYLLYLQKEGRASSTVSRTLASLRSYYLFMMQNGVVKSNPTSNLEAPHVEKKIPKRKIHAAIVIIEAMENMKFLLMFLIPCFRVYQMVLGLIIFSLFLVADDHSIMHGQYTLLHGIDNLFIVSYYQNGGSTLVDLLKELHNLLGCLRVKITSWLVCKKDVRTVYNRPGKGNSLLLST